MLRVVNTRGELDDCQLLKVYESTIRQSGKRDYRFESEQHQKELAEQDFLQYLDDVFFRIRAAKYFIWEEQGKYVSAVRTEPYEDGVLIESLETEPSERGKGYGSCLLKAVLDQVGSNGMVRFYSHIKNNNFASIRVHRKCGFCAILDYGVMVDGTVDGNCKTFSFCSK